MPCHFSSIENCDESPLSRSRIESASLSDVDTGESGMSAGSSWSWFGIVGSSYGGGGSG